MALQTTRMQGIRQRDTNRTAVADQQLANQFAQPVRSVQQRGERLQQGQRETRLGLLQRPDNVRVGRRLENREPIISWKGAANRAHAGDRNAYGQQDAGGERRFGPQGLTFDEAERVAKFKQQEIRDMAGRALAERNQEFGERERIGRFQRDIGRDAFEQERLGRLDTHRQTMDTNQDRRLETVHGWAGDEQQRKEDMHPLNKAMFENNMNQGKEDRAHTLEMRNIERDTAQERLEQMRNPRPKDGPQQPLSKGNEGFIASEMRAAGIPESELYTDGGHFTNKATELFSVIDELARRNPEADMDDIIEQARERVGFQTEDDMQLEKLDRTIETGSRRERNAAKAERDRLLAMRRGGERQRDTPPRESAEADTRRTPPPSQSTPEQPRRIIHPEHGPLEQGPDGKWYPIEE